MANPTAGPVPMDHSTTSGGGNTPQAPSGGGGPPPATANPPTSDGGTTHVPSTPAGGGTNAPSNPPAPNTPASDATTHAPSTSTGGGSGGGAAAATVNAAATGSPDILPLTPVVLAPFTRLHMIQADRGDALLLEYRESAGGPIKHWLIDGGDNGRLYEDDTRTCGERLFEALNTFPCAEKNSSAAAATGDATAPGIACFDRLIVTHPDADHITGIHSIFSSLMPEFRASDSAVPYQPSPLPLGLSEPRKYYSWRGGIGYIHQHNSLPFANIWVNEQESLRWNFPVAPSPQSKLWTTRDSTGKVPEVAKPADGSWMTTLLDSIGMPNPGTVLNTQFCLSDPKGPDVGVLRSKYTGETWLDRPIVKTRQLGSVYRERARALNSCTAADAVLAPAEPELVVAVFKAGTGPRGDPYGRVRPTGNKKVQPRRVVDQWATLDALDANPDSGSNEANRMSIVVGHAINGADGQLNCLLTGDSNGADIRAGILASTPDAKISCWNTIKIPHHGSCYNCALKDIATGKYKRKDDMPSMCRRFFAFFKAKNYCISSDPYHSGTPNPDIYTIGSLVDGFADWSAAPPGTISWNNISIILTNGMSYNSYKLLLERAEQTGVGINVYFMKHGKPYCTTDASEGPMGDNLQKIESKLQFANLYKTVLLSSTVALFSSSRIAAGGDIDEADLKILDSKVGSETYNTLNNPDAKVAKAATPNTTTVVKASQDSKAYRNDPAFMAATGTTRRKSQKQLKLESQQARQTASALQTPFPFGPPASSPPTFFGSMPMPASNPFTMPMPYMPPNYGNSGYAYYHNTAPSQYPPTNQGSHNSHLAVVPSEQQKAFVISCSILGAPDGASPIGHWAHADQGSELNIITLGLAAELELDRRSLKELGFAENGIHMRTADHRDVRLTEYVCFEVEVCGIVRRIQCFVNPAAPARPPKNGSSADLLLGIPWLFDVCATLRIRDFTLELGDVSRGETVQVIAGQPLIFCDKHQLLMYPESTLGQLEASRICYAHAAESSTGSEKATPDSDGAVTEPPPITLQQIWHSLNISGFKFRDMPSLLYFKDGPTPQLGEYGPTSLVNLPQFIDRLKADSTGVQSDPSTATVNTLWFQKLANWFPKTAAYPGGSDAILGTFLASFFDPDAGASIMSAIPLSPNGPTVDMTNLGGQMTMAAIAKLPIFNVRWEVSAPSGDPAVRLQVISCYFEIKTGLNMPLILTNGLTPEDLLSWIIPFGNSSTSQGQFCMVHDAVKGIRVKILWPMYQNRSMIAHFDSVLKFSKSKLGKPMAELVSLPCTGTAYMKTMQSDCMANYDIQFGDMDLVDAFDHFSPLEGKFQTLLSSALDKVGIQSLTNFVAKATTFKLRDLGIVFRQVQPMFNAVNLDDLYGTIDPADFHTTIELPGANWNFPLDDLPALTLTVGNVAEKGNKTASIAFTKPLADLGFVAFQGTFALSKWRPEFDASVFCNQGTSLGTVLEHGLEIIGPNFMDDDMKSQLHIGSFGEKAIADIDKVLDEIMLPYARIQVSKLASGSFGVTELELQLQLKPVSFPADNPVIQLRAFELLIVQQRDGGPVPGSAAGKATTKSSTFTTISGKASLMLGGIDADVKFIYNPSDDDTLRQLALNPSPPTIGRKLVIDINFPSDAPTIGDLVNQVIDDASLLAGKGSCSAYIPSSLQHILDVVAFETAQLTLASDQMENSPWYLASIYVRFSLRELFDDISAFFGDALTFENPSLTVRVDYPTIPAKRGFDIQMRSFICIEEVVCDIFADFSTLRDQSGLPADTICLSFDWSRSNTPLTLGHVLRLLADEIIDAVLGSAGKSYEDALIDIMPNNLKELVNDVEIRKVQIAMANFSTDPVKSKYSLARIYVEVGTSEQPWSPFGDGWAHLTFSNTSLVFSHYSAAALADPASGTQQPTQGMTLLNFATEMGLGSRRLDVMFSYENSPTQTSFSLMLAEAATDNYTLLDLIGDMLNDITGAHSISIPDDARKIFDLSLQNLTISYTKTKTPSAPTESVVFMQSGGATFLGVDFASLSITCTKVMGVWGYDLQFTLQPEVRPFARVLPVPGVEDLTVVNGAFSILKGPAPAPANLAPMMPSTGGDGLSIFLSGGLKLGGNDFMNLVGTIVKVPEVDFALQNNGTLTVAIPVGKLELIVAGHPMFSIERFLLQVSQGNVFLSAEMDFLCEWLAPSIKDHPIGFRFALGLGADGSLNISIYAVDPKTGQQYADMSKDRFIVHPFYIPGLVMYPFHFTMRWLAEAMAPEALSAGGGFAIEGSDIDNVFVFSIDARMPTQNYIKLDIQDLTLSAMFGVLFPTNNDMKAIFSRIDIGFKRLDLNLSPAQKQFHLYGDLIFLALKGRVIADVDPTKGIMGAATLDPLDFGNGLVKLVSYSSGPTVGPFLHINTNIMDIVTGRVPQNPKTPEWASLTSGDPRLDNSTFAMTGKFHFLALELDVFGLLDHDGLVLMTYMGIGANVPGMSVSFDRQMSISISKTQLSASASCTFGLEFDIPSTSIGGIKLGSFPHQSINLGVTMSLVIRYDTNNWLNDGLVYEASFIVDILGLHLDIPHMKIEITVKDLKDLPHVIESFVRDKVIDFLEDKIVGVAQEAWKDTKAIGTEALDTLSKDFNVAEHDVAHAMTEFGMGAEHTANMLKNEFGMGLDECVGVFVGLGHDVSDFCSGVSNAFNVSKIAVIGSTVLQGACSLEYAVASGLGQGLDDVRHFGSGLIGTATDLGNVAGKGLDDLEDKAKDLGGTIKSDITDLGNNIKGGISGVADKAKDGITDTANKAKDGLEDLGNKAKDGITDTANKAKDGITDTANKAKDGITDTANKAKDGLEDTGKKIESGGKKILHGIGHAFGL